MEMSEAEVKTTMAQIDADGGGDIDLGEFSAWFLGLDVKEESEAISKVGRLKMMSMLAGSSVEALCKRAPSKGAPIHGITSGASLGAHMDSYGFCAVPSLRNSDPAKVLQEAGVTDYNFGSASVEMHGTADGAGNVDAICVQLPARCWAAPPAPPKGSDKAADGSAVAAVGSAAEQWGERLADSLLGFASVNCGPLFIPPGRGCRRGPKQKTKLNPFGFLR